MIEINEIRELLELGFCWDKHFPKKNSFSLITICMHLQLYGPRRNDYKKIVKKLLIEKGYKENSRIFHMPCLITWCDCIDKGDYFVEKRRKFTDKIIDKYSIPFI